MVQTLPYSTQPKIYNPHTTNRPLPAQPVSTNFPATAYRYQPTPPYPSLPVRNLPNPAPGFKPQYPVASSQFPLSTLQQPYNNSPIQNSPQPSESKLHQWALAGVGLTLLGGVACWIATKQPHKSPASQANSSDSPPETPMAGAPKHAEKSTEQAELPQQQPTDDAPEFVSSTQAPETRETAAEEQPQLQRSQGLAPRSRRPHPPIVIPRYLPTEVEIDEMRTAISDGDNSTVKTLLRKGFDPNQILNPDKDTPLFVAAEKEQLEIVRTLFQHRADPNFSPSYFGSPLIRAVMRSNISIIQALIANGANVNAKNSQMWGTNDSALDWAAYAGNPEVFQLLLDHGATPEVDSYDVDVRLRGKSNPLITAVDYDHPEIIRMLSAYNPHPDLVSYALRKASFKSSPEVIQALVEYCIPDEERRRAQLQFVFRRSSGSPNFERLIKSESLRQAWGEDYMLNWTLNRNKVENLQLLLEAGLNPNHPFTSGQKPLNIADSYKAAVVLLQYGATANDGATKQKLNEFLKAACNANDVQSAQLFLENGAQHPDERTANHSESPDTEDYKNYRKVVMAILKQSVQRSGGIAHPFGHLFPTRRTTETSMR